MFKLKVMKKQIKALEKAIQKADNKEEAEVLLDLQRTLISLCEVIKRDEM